MKTNLCNNQNCVCTKNNFCYLLIPMKIRKIKKKRKNFYMDRKEVC